VTLPAVRRLSLSLVVPLFAVVAAPPACGQGWLPAAWFSAADANPEAMHPLAEKDGPWLILATTFRGEAAREDARRLANELRTRHRLKAHTHEQAFDYTGEQAGVGLNPDGSPKRMRYANAERVIEVAVLIGDFASFEDPRGQKTLQAVKALRPASLGGPAAKNRLVADFLQANRQPAGAEGKPPLHAAIMSPNPLLPDDYFARQEVDDFVLAMNADVDHSLLDCPGRYTVRVATFSGSGSFATDTAEPAASTGGFVDMNRFLAALKGSGWRDPQLRGVERESRLVEAADNAHRLTEALRRAGWQAWEFHDRDSSIVCVGAVDQLAVPTAAGRPEPHPEIARIVKALGPDPAALARGQILPRSVAGILLDVDPKPIDVPRRPAGRR
jgi:hypothetical protein